MPYNRNEFEDSHSRIESKHLSEINFDKNYNRGVYKEIQNCISDSLNFNAEKYNQCLFLYQLISSAEDTSILRSFQNEDELKFKLVEDTNIFISNVGFVSCSQISFYTDTVTKSKFKVNGGIYLDSGFIVGFQFNIKGEKGSREDGFKCVKTYIGKRRNFKAYL